MTCNSTIQLLCPTLVFTAYFYERNRNNIIEKDFENPFSYSVTINPKNILQYDLTVPFKVNNEYPAIRNLQQTRY